MAENQEPEPLPLTAGQQHDVLDALGTLTDRLGSLGHLQKGDSKVEDDGPKSWFIDPYTVVDYYSTGFRQAPGYLTNEALRQAAEREPIQAACIGHRVTQVSSFSRPQPNKYSVGFKIKLRGAERARRLTPSEKERALYIERFLLNTGMGYSVDRDSFDTFLRKFTRDSLIYDQANAEKVRTLGGDLHAFYAVPSETIRLAYVRGSGRPIEDDDELRSQIRYVQLIDQRRWREFTADEMMFCVRNPRTHTRVYRYGFPEIEVLMTTITALLWSTEYSRRAFSQGSMIKALVNFQGKLKGKTLEELRKQYMAQMSGVMNAHKLMFVNSEGMQVTPLQWSNKDMEYQAWMEFLIKMSASVWQMDPAEIGFDLRGSGVGQQPLFMSSNDAQQKLSKDRGLAPLLRFVEDSLNRHVVWPIDDRYELAFVGLDAKTEEQNAQLRMQQAQTYMTLNEVRALEDLEPVKHGDKVMNPVYTSVLAMEMQKEMAAGPAAGPGGAGAEQPPPTEEDQAFLADPGEEERRGAARLLEFLGQQGDAEAKDGQGGGDDGPNPLDESSLFREDWASSVHASTRGPDLKKSAAKKGRRFVVLGDD